MPKRIDEPCPICGSPCENLSHDLEVVIAVCPSGHYECKGLIAHNRLSRIVRAAERLEKASCRLAASVGCDVEGENAAAATEYLLAKAALSKAVNEGGERSDGR
jgi:formylmethanofuran dehydrogenase subunit B